MQVKKWLITLFISFALLIALGFIKFTQIQAAIAFGESFPEPSETVNVSPLTPVNWQATYQVSGLVKPTQEVTLMSEFSGVITEVNAVSGEQVKAQTTFITLSSSQEESQLAAIEAKIALAKINVQRATQLFQQNATGQQALDIANAELIVAEADYAAVRALIEKKSIRFPFSGKLGLHELTVGQFIQAQTPLVSLFNENAGYWVDFSIPLDKASWLSDAMQLSINEQPVTVQLVSSANQVSKMTRKLTYRYAITEGPLFKGNMQVNISLSNPQQHTALRLPSIALRYDPIGTYIYGVVEDDSGQTRAQRFDVNVLEQKTNHIIVENNLPQTLKVATDGAFKLSPNLLVKVANDE